MRQALVFSNVGSWESDMVGLVKVVHVGDDTDPQSFLTDLVVELYEVSRPSNQPESVAPDGEVLDSEEINRLLEKWELSYFTDLDFHVGMVTDDEVGIFVALTFI